MAVHPDRHFISLNPTHGSGWDCSDAFYRKQGGASGLAPSPRPPETPPAPHSGRGVRQTKFAGVYICGQRTITSFGDEDANANSCQFFCKSYLDTLQPSCLTRQFLFQLAKENSYRTILRSVRTIVSTVVNS